MRGVVVGLLLAALWGRIGAGAEPAGPWSWTLVEPGFPKSVVRQGMAQITRSGQRFEALLTEEDAEPSKVQGKWRGGKLSATYEMSHTDVGPSLLSQGRWLTYKHPTATMEMIWLNAPLTGHYLVFSRTTKR